MGSVTVLFSNGFKTFERSEGAATDYTYDCMVSKLEQITKSDFAFSDGADCVRANQVKTLARKLYSLGQCTSEAGGAA